MIRGMFVGRFSPFHLGHLQTVKLILQEVDEFIIGIGSAQQSHTTTDPFTAGERLQMTRQALITENLPIEDIYCIPIYDIFRNPVWISHVQSFCPSFSVVFTNNNLLRRLFSEAGYEVQSSKLLERDVFKGSHIRQLMIEDKQWDHLVPLSVYKFILNIDGVKRLQEIAQSTD